MKCSDLFVRCLEAEGVEYVFAVPGEENLDLLESLRMSSIRVVITRHEQGAAFMAATYGRMTGKAGVCMATLGPGATNLVTGVAYAQLNGIPLVAITGQKGIRLNWQADFQVIDVVAMMHPITKQSVQIQGPMGIAKEVRDSFKVARTERLGACHLELPEDVAREVVDESFRPLRPGLIRRPDACGKAINSAADTIRSARHPILLLSSRAQRHRVRRALRAFCDATNIYAVHTQLGKGALGDDHANSLFAFGIHKHDYVNCAVDRADLVIAVGYSTREHPPSVWNQNVERAVMHVDFTPAKTQAYYNPTVELVGDIASSLNALREALGTYRYEGSGMASIRRELERRLFVDGADDDAFPPRPRRIVAECRKVLADDDIICMDNGIYKLWFSRHFRTYNISTFLMDNTLATMGAGLPSALGAKLVAPERRVLAVAGDGGFMMNSQELETAMRLKLPVVTLLLNDNGFGFMRWKQRSLGLPDFALDLGNPDFVKYAESYGAKGYRVESADQLSELLEEAFRQEAPALIECPIDYSENAEVWDKELEEIICPLD